MDIPRRRRVVSLVAASAVLVTTAVAAVLHAQSADAVQTYAIPASGSVTVAGHGNGHGHGLSQYGAHGAAMAGLSAAQIIAFYYPGTKLVALKPSTIRVLITNAGATTRVAPSPGLTVSGVGAVPTTGIGAYRLVASGSGERLDKLVGSTWSTVRNGLPNGTTFSRPQGNLRLMLADNTSTTYSGTVTAWRSGSSVISVNNVSLDTYTAGVVPREMPSSWEPAAVQAQAIAARSYARQAVESGAAGRQYDICDTSQCQVYGGQVHYDTSLHVLWQDDPAALTGNSNLVAQYNGKTIFAQFSASNGGWTVAGGQPYLVAKQDPYDNTKTGDPYLNWTRTADVGNIASSFGLKSVSSIQVTSRDGHGEWGGRVLAGYVNGVNAAGTSQHIAVTGFQLQDALDVPHNWFAIQPPNALPRGHLDRINIGGSHTFAVFGWTFDPNHPDMTGLVSVSVDGTDTAVQQTNMSRPDVQKVFGLLTDMVGFGLSVKVSPGAHTLCVVGHDRDSSAKIQAGCSKVTMPDQVGWADIISAGSGTIRVAGWALDPDHKDLPGQYQIVVDGAAGPTKLTNVSRPDVQKAYHMTTATLGYDVTFPATSGSHAVCVQSLDREGGAVVPVRCSTVTVD